MRSAAVRDALAVALVLALPLPSAAAGEGQAEQPGYESVLLSNTRQLIYEGLRSGEGYFSADGTRTLRRRFRRRSRAGACH